MRINKYYFVQVMQHRNQMLKSAILGYNQINRIIIQTNEFGDEEDNKYKSAEELLAVATRRHSSNNPHSWK